MSTTPLRIHPPSKEELEKISSEYNLDLSSQELETFSYFMNKSFESFNKLEDIQSPHEELAYTDRRPGYRPGQKEDPYNAFITRCEVHGSADGPLAGYEVGLKDNISLAGVKMTAGSQVLEDFVPSQDATIVKWLLEAGATITGKLNMGDMSTSNDEFSAMAPALNPHNTDHMVAGSSSGSAVAVVAGEVDLAIGADQGGSIRLPAAMCGCVGHKPTYGLVPYTGIMSAVPSMDHTGPMANTVKDCAVALDVICGDDPLDPRQTGTETAECEAALSDEHDSINVGVLEEGFEMDEKEGFADDKSDQRIEDCVRESIERFGEEGAVLENISIPQHSHGAILGMSIGPHEIAALVKSDGVGRFMKGAYDTQLAEAFGKARKTNANDFHPRVKLLILTAQYLSEKYNSRYYTKAQNLRRKLTESYDQALEQVDVLAMPTAQKEAPEIFDEPTLRKCLDRPRGHNNNTMPFNLSGHPAISVPCGTVDGLPVGIQFVGKQFADDAVLQVAHAFEQNVEAVNIE